MFMNTALYAFVSILTKTDTRGERDVRTISDTLYPAAAVDRLYCSGLIQPSDSFGLSSL